jgi:TRAP-type C4-dicarboxylate transport system permease small subunit
MSERFMRAWNWTERFLAGLLALTAVLSTFYGVVMRYVFSKSPEWVEEIVIYTVIWAVFLIASTLSEEQGHVGATFVVEQFPLKARRLIEIGTGLLALVFCILIGLWGYQIVQVTYAMDERSLTSIRFPLWIAYLSVPVGATLIVLRYARRIYRLIFRFDPGDLIGTHEMSRLQHLEGLDSKIPSQAEKE